MPKIRLKSVLVLVQNANMPCDELCGYNVKFGYQAQAMPQDARTEFYYHVLTYWRRKDVPPGLTPQLYRNQKKERDEVSVHSMSSKRLNYFILHARFMNSCLMNEDMLQAPE